jgi:oxygen-independent coproporphyrinogen-3 oxidase
VDVAAVGARYGVDTCRRFGPGLAPFVTEGLVLREGDRIRLTREGMLVANEIMSVFV